MTNLTKLFTYFVPTFLVLYLTWVCFPVCFKWFTQLSVIGSLLVISWTLGYFFYDRFNTETVSPTGKIVLITGCDTGFGHELAVKLDRFGFHIFASVLFPDGEGARALQQKCSPNLRVIRMDVTKQDEVEHVVEEIRKTNKPLWGVVNNAGVGMGAYWDWGNDVDEHRKVFEVNLFGLIRVTKNCIPLLRETRGRIVNIASAAGRITVGGMSHYSMAKHSVRVFSDSLRREFLMTKDHQIQVITIEPAFYKTEIINQEAYNRARERIISQTPEQILNSYDLNACNRVFRRTHNLIEKIARRNLGEVTNAIANGIVLKHPKQFYRCAGYGDVIFVWALSHAPEVLLDKLTYLGHRLMHW